MYQYKNGTTYTIWTYNRGERLSYVPYLAVFANTPTSYYHPFTLTMDRCAGDSNRNVMISAVILRQSPRYQYSGTTNVSIEGKLLY